mgnify:CR=1 FL=1
MMGKKKIIQNVLRYRLQAWNDLVPSGHLVRKLEEAIDLNFIYDEVKDLYKPYGRESIDPVVLMKIDDPPIRVWHPFHAQNNQRD